MFGLNKKLFSPEMSTDIDNLTDRNASILANFLEQNGCSCEARSVVENAIDNNSIKFLNENLELSEKSPFNVDMTQVLDTITLPASDLTNSANKKFLCAYGKLLKSSNFKKLFINTFRDSKKYNVKFEITDLAGLTAGETGGSTTLTDGIFTGINIIIKIDKSKLLSGSTFDVTLTILHESIHAFLKLKLRDCNAGTTLDYINNQQLGETIKDFYANFTCSSPKQSQHEFIFDNMIPTFQNVFNEIGHTNLTSQSSISYVENDKLPLENNPSIDWNWQDFYYYFSLEGLHKTNSFKYEIENNSLKNDLFRAYTTAGSKFTQTCN